MRKLLSATLAAATVAGGALAVGQAAQAQPYGYYQAPAQTSGYYDNRGYYHPGYASQYAPPAYSGYSGYSVYPGYSGSTGYNSYNSGNGLSAGLAVLGSVLGLNNGYNGNTAYNGYSGDSGYDGYGSGVPVDRYGADPNGMIAPDGHRIKCKLRTSYDNYYGRSVTRRECR